MKKFPCSVALLLLPLFFFRCLQFMSGYSPITYTLILGGFTCTTNDTRLLHHESSTNRTSYQTSFFMILNARFKFQLLP